MHNYKKLAQRKKSIKPMNILKITLIFYLSIIMMTPSVLILNTRSDPVDPWWDLAWHYRKEINIDHTKVDANLVNFPILINLVSDTNLANHAQSTGNDIVFTDINGNKLNHEIELYQSTTGHLVAWVNVPNLSSTTNTRLYVYYGNNLCNNQQNPQGTWNSDYIMVQHMNETNTVYDSTSNQLSGTNTGTTLSSTGIIDGCHNYDSTTDLYNFGSTTTLDPGLNSWTITLWTKVTFLNNHLMLIKWKSNNGYYIKLFDGWGGKQYFRVEDGTHTAYRYWTTNWADNNWHLITMVINRNTQLIDLYLDGTLNNGGGPSSITSFTSINPLSSLQLYGSSTGTQDEFTISKTVRNNSWIKTSYNNQNNPSSFYSISNEEAAILPNQPPIISEENPANNSVNVNINCPIVNITIEDPEGDLFNWTITTSPDIGTNSETYSSNGTKTCSISDLSYSTTYTWTVKANDGNQWTNITYTFTAQEPPINNPPVITNPNPANNSSGVSINLSSLNITIQDPEGDHFIWTIKGQYIITATQTDDTNGTKVANLMTPLPPNTKITWYVNATDISGSNKWTNSTFSFTTKSTPSSWWNQDWIYRKEINIDHTKVDANLVNFPILINLVSDTNLANHAQSTGNDIVFTDINGNKLNHEIELYQSTTGHLVAWVNVPNLSSTTNTRLYVYYGNNLCNNQQNPQGTWNSDYIMVQHMNETNTVYDSTSNQLSGTNTGTTLSSTGIIDGCHNYDSTTDLYNFGSTTTLDPGLNSWTITLWTKVTFLNNHLMLIKWKSNNGYYIKLFDGWGGKQYFRVEDGTHTAYRYWTTNWADNNWHLITMVINRNTQLIDLYLDGTLNNGGGPSSITSFTSINPLSSLQLYGSSTGTQDEFTISKTVRNNSWIKTSYNNQNNPSSFYSIGSQEETTTPPINNPPILTNPNPANNSSGVLTNLSSVNITIQDPEGDHFNWTIHGQYIITASNTDDANGTKTANLITPLPSNTKITWYLNITDLSGSNKWTNKTYSFTTKLLLPNQQPILSNEIPQNGTEVGIYQTSVSVNVQDPDGDLFNWYINGPSIVNAYGMSDTNGTKIANLITPLPPNTNIIWSVHVTDSSGSGKWTNKTYGFTTKSIIPTLKWSEISVSGDCNVGPSAADVNNDGWIEVIRSGTNGIVVYNGTTSDVVWTHSMVMYDNHNPIEIIDLNKDGILEIICSYDTGTMALHGNDGSVYWYNPDAPLQNKHFVAGDINADGYPEVYVCTIGQVTALTHDGQIFASTYTYWPCYGGLSLGDTNYDGVFELYLNERSYGYDENTVGKGVRAFWASNLTERWNHSEMLSSSHCPTLVDVNKDGILDIVSLQQSGGGIAVFNSADGSVIHQSTITGLTCHSQPTIYDIDGDGNLELIACGGSDTWSKPLIWDLYKWQKETGGLLDSNGFLPYECLEPPAIADIDGDGFVEILACTSQNISIFNHNYQFIGFIPLSNPYYYGMSMIMAQDIDNDGLTELVLNRGSSIYVYDTIGLVPTPRALSQFNYYSQHRGRSPYYTEYGPLAPIINNERPTNGAGNQIRSPLLSVYAFDYQNNLMNLTFKTNASTGIWHTIKNEFNVHEGIYTVNATEMNAAGTTYWWNVTATDSTGKLTYKLYKFITMPESSWWNPDWLYRKEIIIDHTKVNANLVNFPVLISLSSDVNLASHAQPNGNDIVFTDKNGNKLNHEIELYQSSTGRLVAWVNVTSLSSTLDTPLCVYYGNSDCGNQQNIHGTWNSDYLMVQHMNETNTVYDSTSNQLSGTNTGTTLSSTGIIDGCHNYDSTTDLYNFGSTTTLDPGLNSWTITLWTKVTFLNNHLMLIKWKSNNGYYIKLFDGWGGKQYFRVEDGTHTAYRYWTTNWADNNWHLITMVINRNTQLIDLYLDGTLNNGGGPSSITSFTSINPLSSLQLYGSSTGTQDEFTISKTVRNNSWIKTSYNNQNNPTTFCSVSNEENLPGEPVVLNEIPQNGATNVSAKLSQLTFTLKDYQGDPMSYTVSTSPNIGFGSGTEVVDGTYTVPINGLNMQTSYTWYVNVNDGTHLTQKVFTFSTGFSVDNWAYRKEITVNKQGEEQCRIYAVMSDNLPNGLLKNDLITAPNSLKTLAPSNPDGWGFAYYPIYGSVPTIARGMVRANNDPGFDTIVEQINTSEPKITLAHIRKCTNGCCITGSDSILDPHPFFRTKNGKIWTFVHNGGISVTIGKNLIGSTYLAANPLNCSEVCADNQNCDSEVYLLLLLKNIEDNNWNVTNGIVATIQQLVAAGGDTSGLNFVLSDGTNMWAFRRHSLTTHTLYYLYDSAAGYTAVASQYPSNSQGNWVALNDYELAILKPNKQPQIINVLEYIPTITEFTNFPVLIDIVDADLAAKAQDTGKDILFTNLDLQKLDFEIESFNTTNGHLVAWVKIPNISMNQETQIYMYYGNENTDSLANQQGVWDSHYMMTQHLEEIAGMSLSDSTSYANNGVPQNDVILNIDGKIDGADWFDGTNDYSSISDSNTLDGAGTWNEMTAETWIYLSANQLGTKVISKRIASSSGTDKSYQIGFQTATPANRLYAGVYTTTSATYKEAGYNTPLALNTWYHVAFTFKSTTGITLYVNGAPVSTTSASGSITASTQPLCLGSTTSAAGFFNGKIDETRISDIARDRNWTLLSYMNQNNSAGFIKVGDEESSSNIILTNAYPSNGATDIPLTPTLQIIAEHTENYLMNITWKANTNEIWTVIGTNTSIGNGTYTCSNTAWANTYNTLYTWKVEVNDGHGIWYNKTLSFTTLAEPNLPPTQDSPILVSELGTNTTNEKLICTNQTTADPNGDTVSNTYHWMKNGVPLTNLLFSFNTIECSSCSGLVVDYSGYHNDGTLIDAVWTPNGILGGAYKFYGSDSQTYITIPDSPTLDGDGAWTDMTMECWVKSGIDNQKTTNIIGKWMTNQPRSYQLGFDSAGNNQLFASVQNTNGFLQTLYSDVSPLITGTWYHIVATYDNGVLNLYINGVLDATASNAGGAITASTVPLRIGCRDNADGSGTERFFDGSIDEVKIYPFALTPEQIYQNYLDSKDGISNESTIVPEETENEDIWQCEITPSDSQLDGTTETSNSLTIVALTGYTLAITIDGSGSIIKNPDKAFYTNGEIVELTAVPNTGSSFSYWSGDLSGPENPKSITMTGDKTVTATFEINIFTITASAGSDGSISPNGAIIVNYGEDKTFNITPDTGYQVYDVLVDGVSQGPLASYTFTAIATDHAITASFEIDQLLVDSTFYTSFDSADLRANSSSQDWYESRNDGPTILTLDTEDIDGNTGKKAKFTQNTTKNAFLSQEFSQPQTGTFSAQWDIYVDSIADIAYDRAGWMLIGDNTVVTRPGPNSDDGERFVYLGFFKNGGGTSGLMNLVARDRDDAWGTFTTVATGLNLKHWYTIKVICDLSADTYDVYVDGTYETTLTSRFAKTSLTHISFAQWNDGAGTFYVDNVFSPPTIRYRLTTIVVGSGSFQRTPGETTYASDSVVMVTANPITGWHFTSWDGDLEGSINPTTITMDSNKTVTANFEIDTFTITASASSGGTIQPDGTVVVNYGVDQTFTITPDEGYHIENVLVDEVAQGAISSYTFNAIDSDHNISASFAIDTYTITASAGTGGSISPSGTIDVNYGSDQIFFITPDTGYNIQDVLIDSTSQGPINSYQFIDIVADHTIVAFFAQINYNDVIFDSNFDMGNLINVQFQER